MESFDADGMSGGMAAKCCGFDPNNPPDPNNHLDDHSRDDGFDPWDKGPHYIAGNASASGSNKKPDDQFIYDSKGRLILRVGGTTDINGKPIDIYSRGVVNPDGSITVTGDLDGPPSTGGSSDETKPSTTEPTAGGGEPDENKGKDLANWTGAGALEGGLVESAIKYGKGAEEDIAPISGRVGGVLKGIAVVAGAIATYQAGREWYEHPTWGNFFKVVGNASITVLAGAGRLNPLVGVGLTILDLTGATDKIYEGLERVAGDK